MSLRSRRFASLLVGGCALALACSSASAHAGRASACKAPPFSVPKETQRAVDAAIDARITGAGAGGASSTVAVRTDYETTTLSQDAAARAWASYTLCLKLAKKLISQDLHDELLRGLMEPPPASRPAVAPVEPPSQALERSEPPGADAALEPASMAGTWQVTSTFRWSTCPPPNDAGGVTAYSWLISVGADQKVKVSVLGNTSYPELTGGLTDGVLLLQGEQVRRPVDSPNGLVTYDGDDFVYYRPRVFIAASSDGKTIAGTRDFTTLVGPVASSGDEDDRVNRYELCMVHFDLEGHR